MAFKEFIREINGNRVEGELIRTIFYSLFTSAILFAVLYYLKLRNIDNFTGRYGFFLLFSVLSYALIAGTIRQVRAYKEFPCMSGMMVGMTSGMVAGFLPGFYIASTNGMFIGSVFGMGIGIGLGIWLGKSSGVMGIMEGTMAGFMGGLMGAMTAIMLLNDNMRAMGVIVFLISATIMFGLNYMIFNETKREERHKKEDHLFTIILTFVLIAVTTWLMVFGPRSALFG